MGMGVVFGPWNGMKAGRFAFEIKALPQYAFEVVREQCEVVANDGKRSWYDRKRSSFRTNVSGLKPSTDPSSLCLPVVGGDERFAPVVKVLGAMRVYSIEPARLREMQDPDSGMALRSDGSNAASVLQELSRSSPPLLVRVKETLAAIVPNTHRVITKKHGNKLSLELTQDWMPAGGGKTTNLRFEAFNMSDGTLRALGPLMAVYQKPPPAVLVVEEPEATIHPGALGAVMDMIREAAGTMQVVVTTHSPEVLDVEWVRDNHLRIVSWFEGATRVSPPSVASRRAMQEHLMGAGELLRANALETPEQLFDGPLTQEQLFQSY
jgi:hypothetical protein